MALVLLIVLLDPVLPVSPVLPVIEVLPVCQRRRRRSIPPSVRPKRDDVKGAGAIV
jgi:hypothetical protein